MSGFAADWLALREPADAAARSAALAEALRAAIGPRLAVDPGAAALRILDLGAGTGSGLRWLAPRLPGAQHWTLVDHDAALLGHAPSAVARWAAARGLAVEGAGPALRVDTRRADLNAELETLPFRDADLIFGTALLDLVSERWLRRLARAAGGTPVLFALTVDGRTAFTPEDPVDEAVRAAFARHQGGDKGFGPALGAAAARRAPEIFAEAGYAVTVADTPWDLGPADGALIRALVDGYAGAAAETAAPPAADLAAADLPAADLAAWRARRHAAADAGGLRLTVGHVDLLALPPDVR